MRVRFMFWTGVRPDDAAVRDVLAFNEYAEDIFEESIEALKDAVASGVAEALDELKFK